MGCGARPGLGESCEVRPCQAGLECHPVTVVCVSVTTDAGPGTDADSDAATTDASASTDAAADGSTDSGLPTTCDPLAITCTGDTRITCAGDGTVAEAFPCPLGCIEEGGVGRCRDLVPAVAAIEPGDFSLGGMAPPILSLGSATINTDTGEIQDGAGNVVRAAGGGLVSGIWFEVLTQGVGGPDIGMFVTDAFSIPPAFVVTFVGANAAAVLAPGPIVIEGTVELVGALGTAGPGGGGGGATDMAGAGAGGGSPGAGLLTSGGGGGGYCGVGGSGAGNNPGLGGSSYGVLNLSMLLGGSGGGGGTMAINPGGMGGGGGGALYMASLTDITIAAGGVINAGGGGGGGTAFMAGAGGGGGSGGAILLEAPDIFVAAGGVVAANGGGGGGDGTDGESGLADMVAAAGGNAGGTAAGGDGSSFASADGADGIAGMFGGGDGGGGGGAGRIRINTRFSSAMLAGTLSPGMITGCASEGNVSVQ